MKKIIGLSVFAVIAAMGLTFFFSTAALSEEMPVLSLVTPESKVDRDYLGLTTDPGDTFTVGDIKADVVVIELFSMYCPYCQEEAPAVNQFHDLALQQKDNGLTIKMLGLGASNTEFEVQQFKNIYQVMFPLLPDQSLEMYDKLKGEGTPGFIIVKLTAKKAPEIVYRQSGGFESAEAFLELLIERVSS